MFPDGRTNLLPEDEIFEKGRSPISRAEAVLIGDGTTDVAGQVAIIVVDLELGEVVIRRRGGTLCGGIPSNGRMVGRKVPSTQFPSHQRACRMCDLPAGSEYGEEPRGNHCDGRNKKSCGHGRRSEGADALF